MAHSKSAEKRIRQNANRRLRNRSARSALRTVIKKFHEAVAGGDAEAVKKAYHAAQVKLDKSASKGVVPKRTASRLKSRLSARAKALPVGD